MPPRKRRQDTQADSHIGFLDAVESEGRGGLSPGERKRTRRERDDDGSHDGNDLDLDTVW